MLELVLLGTRTLVFFLGLLLTTEAESEVAQIKLNKAGKKDGKQSRSSDAVESKGLGGMHQTGSQGLLCLAPVLKGVSTTTS